MELPYKMANQTKWPSLVPPLMTYCEYFARLEMDTFHGRYAAILHLYYTETSDSASNVGRQVATQKIYVMAQDF